MNLEWGKEEPRLDGPWSVVPHLYCCSASSWPRAATSIMVGTPRSYMPAGHMRGGDSGGRRGSRGRRGVPLRATSSFAAGIAEHRCLAALRNIDDAPSINRRRSLAAWRGNTEEAWMALAARPSPVG
jgi:hypothetical protein